MKASKFMESESAMPIFCIWGTIFFILAVICAFAKLPILGIIVFLMAPVLFSLAFISYEKYLNRPEEKPRRRDWY